MATALKAEESILPRGTILIDGDWRSTASGGAGGQPSHRRMAEGDR